MLPKWGSLQEAVDIYGATYYSFKYRPNGEFEYQGSFSMGMGLYVIREGMKNMGKLFIFTGIIGIAIILSGCPDPTAASTTENEALSNVGSMEKFLYGSWERDVGNPEKFTITFNSKGEMIYTSEDKPETEDLSETKSYTVIAYQSSYFLDTTASGGGIELIIIINNDLFQTWTIGDSLGFPLQEEFSITDTKVIWRRK
ncbi:MAG: hypothetical protein B0D92_07065 [Spirochaeta sp. LUC14_002_19_P3]|nr:MAG: hypothetical protein B0D92_07065 [Spirochaeta sp. LUC14_002_19_P3]